MATGAGTAGQVKLLLDEMWPPAIAEALRDRGHEVVAVAERRDLRGMPDAALFDEAQAGCWVIVTENVVDYRPLAAAAMRAGRAYPAIIYTSNEPIHEPIGGRPGGWWWHWTPCSRHAIALSGTSSSSTEQREPRANGGFGRAAPSGGHWMPCLQRRIRENRSVMNVHGKSSRHMRFRTRRAEIRSETGSTTRKHALANIAGCAGQPVGPVRA